MPHRSHASHQMLARVGTEQAPHSSPSPQETPWQLGRKREKEKKKNRHSTHALPSSAKRLRSSTSVFFRAEITERALMWNMHLLPFLHLLCLTLFFPLFPLAKSSSPMLWWLVSSFDNAMAALLQSLCSKLQFFYPASLVCIYADAPSDFHFGQLNHRNAGKQSNVFKRCLRIPAVAQHMGWQLLHSLHKRGIV